MLNFIFLDRVDFNIIDNTKELRNFGEERDFSKEAIWT